MSSSRAVIALLLTSMLTILSCVPDEGPQGGMSGTGGSEGETEQPDGGEETVIPTPEGNVIGKVTDALTGEPIAGVPVTDGYSYTITNANGEYGLFTNELTRSVYVSVPAEYEIPTDADNHPKFYVNGTFNEPDITYSVNFSLTPRSAGSDNFMLASLADVHIYENSDLERFKRETLPDLVETAGALSAQTYKECVAVFVGDQMSDRMNMVTSFKTSLAGHSANGRKLPFFHCIGNHDFANGDIPKDVQNGDPLMTWHASKTFVENFGPTDYSFNIGKVHVVVMNNMAVTEKDNTTRYGAVQCINYKGELSDEQIAWLKDDLDYVEKPEEKTVVLYVHVPIKGSSAKNYQAAAQLLTAFKEGHIVSGHSHHIVNHVHNRVCKGGKKVYEHNLQMVGGMWWNSNISTDGAPAGYSIFRFSKNGLYDSYNKATGADWKHQMRVYNGNDTYNGRTAGSGVTTPARNESFSWPEAFEGKFVARVWDADADNWTVEFVQNGVSTPMTRETSISDECTSAFSYNIHKYIYGNENGYRVKTDNFWTIAAPSGDPATEQGWKIVARHKFSPGWTRTYECSRLQRDYTGFAEGSTIPTDN